VRPSNVTNYFFSRQKRSGKPYYGKADGQFNAIARLASASGIIGPKPSEKGLDLLSKE